MPLVVQMTDSGFMLVITVFIKKMWSKKDRICLTILLLILSGIHQTLRAQLTESDTLRWGYQWSSSGSFLSGNVERFLWINQATLSHRRDVWGFKSVTNYQYDTIRRRRTENDVISRNFLYLQPRKRIYPFLMLWIERNLRRKIDYRYQTGPGVSFVVWQKPRHRLKLSTTITYEWSRFQRSDFNNSDFDGTAYPGRGEEA